FFSSNADYDAAAKEFLEVVKSEPSWTEGYQWLGSALKQLGDLDAAMAAYRKAIRLAPEDSRPHVDLGVCLTEKKRYTQAIKMLKRGLDLKPYCTEADIRVFLAEALLRSGNIAGACAEWRLVLKIEPGYPSCGQPQKEAERLLEKYEKAT
ncbi:MAG: tetratricopeptide repeat protein, partial [Acidobacteria bacterium]|nr:tetratricopeptide repeat protein [Acidobacteriota bacterium]